LIDYILKRSVYQRRSVHSKIREDKCNSNNFLKTGPAKVGTKPSLGPDSLKIHELVKIGKKKKLHLKPSTFGKSGEPKAIYCNQSAMKLELLFFLFLLIC